MPTIPFSSSTPVALAPAQSTLAEPVELTDEQMDSVGGGFVPVGTNVTIDSSKSPTGKRITGNVIKSHENYALIRQSDGSITSVLRPH
jgi:hypothetical protein